MNSLTELLEDQLKDLYSAEKQLTKALPQMAKKSAAPSLKQAFTSHLEETNNQVKRLEEIGESLGVNLKGKTCKAMEGLIEEGKEMMQQKGEAMVIDAGLIAAAQRVEHYEISAYGSARALAEQLGHEDAVELLQATLDEESAADEKLNTISLEEVLPEATTGLEDSDEDEEDEDEDEEEEEEETEEEPVASAPASTRGGGASRGSAGGSSRGGAATKKK